MAKKFWWICEEEDGNGVRRLFLYDEGGRMKVVGTRMNVTYGPICDMEEYVEVVEDEPSSSSSSKPASKRRYKFPVKVSLI